MKNKFPKSKNQNKLLVKLKIKGLITCFIYNAILLTISYFLDRFFQMLMFVLFFELMQSSFKYRFHADTIVDNPIKAIRYCKIITIIVEIVYLIFCNNFNISLYSNLFIIFGIALFSCILELSLEFCLVKQSQLKDKETLLRLCTKANLTENAKNRMVMKYIDGKTYREIADLECVDIETIKKSINRSRNKILKNQDYS